VSSRRVRGPERTTKKSPKILNLNMPNTKSAIKALRQDKRRHAHNLSKKKVLKNTIRQYRKLTDSQKIEEAQKLLPTLYKKIDKAAKTNLIKKNKAARLKSRLSKKLTIPNKELSSRGDAVDVVIP